MWPLDVLAAILFVSSSGLLFNKKFRENPALLIAAGLLALPATYFTIDAIVTHILDQRLGHATKSSIAEPLSAPVSTISNALVAPNEAKSARQSASSPQTVALASADVRAAAAAYDRRDFASALKVLSPKAEAGDPVAQYFAGIMNLRGEGIARNPTAGVRLLRMSATAGIADAQNFMAAFYRRGDHVPRDYAQAMNWYVLAAKQNYKNAQYWIALMHRDGHGAPADNKLAYMWACIAASGGPPEAISLRDRLLKLITPEEAAQAQHDATAWQESSITPKPTSVYALAGASP
jgi:TPR repeat protein